MKPLSLLLATLLAAPAGLQAQSVTTLQPQDVQARLLMWSGHANRATQMMRDYVDAHPDDRAAVLDLARYLTWSGDFAGAKHLLDTHPDAARSDEGQTVLAAVMAWGGWIHAALRINAGPLARDPAGLMPNYTQAIALRQSARPRDAWPYVQAVKRAKPGSKDARDLEKSVRIHTDSFVTLGYNHGSDSDHLERLQPTLRAEIAQGDAIRWTAELGRWHYRSPADSPFANVDGSRSVSESRGLFGIRYAPSSYTELGAAAGYSSIPGHGLTLWRLDADQRFSDSFRGNLLVDHDRVAISPRSVSLGLSRTSVTAHLQWTPDLSWVGDLWMRHDDFSDQNRSWDWNAALRRAIVRRQGFMLDLGGAVEHLSFDRNPGHGYYAPANYRRYAVTANAYVGLGENAGLSLQASLGRQRDETFTSWRKANDISASLVVGIFSPWQLSVNAAYSQRLLDSGAYQGRSWGIALTRRF